MLEDLWNTISDWMGETMSSLLESVLHATIFRLFYYIERMLCWIIQILYEMFEIFAGLVRVEYNGDTDYLINIFFSNRAVSNLYWGMALIGIVLTFGFTIAAVVRKMFDASGKQQQSLGQIIWGGIRSIIIILGMTAIMTVVLNGTGVLMQQINYLFTDPYNLHLPDERTFTGEEYAAMGRVLSTIGNYSVVDSKDNRYNMNLCFNDIRGDMYYLQQQGVFDYSYYEEDEEGNPKQSWQSVLAKIASSCNLKQDVKVDMYNDGVSRSIGEAMKYLKTTAEPRPLETIKKKSFAYNEAHLDRMIFLMGTFRAAKNSDAYNKNPAFNDPLRGQYYYEEGKSIYSFENVDSDFDIGFRTDYLLVWIAAVAIIFDLVVIILNCVARIFNMLFLYLIAPPVIAAQPFDNGGKTKQWMTAFLVQSLSVFGTVIAMRLLLLFLPMVESPEFVLFKSNPILNAFAKVVLIYGGFEAAKKSSSILTGILADSAGWQSVQAGDMSGSAAKALGTATAVGKAVGVKALGVASLAAKPVTNLVSRPFKSLAKHYAGLGTGKATTESGKIKEQVAHEAKVNKAREQYNKEHGISDGRTSGGSGHSTSSSSSTSKTNTNLSTSHLKTSTKNPAQQNQPGANNPAPVNPAPAPVNPAPVNPAPVNPAPVNNQAPVNPAPAANPAPVNPPAGNNPPAVNPVQANPVQNIAPQANPVQNQNPVQPANQPNAQPNIAGPNNNPLRQAAVPPQIPPQNLQDQNH